MIRFALLLAAVVAAPALAQAQGITKLEVVGNHAGRSMKLEIDGKTVFEGYGHLDPPGVTWTLNIAPGSAPAPVLLTLAPCEKPFAVDVPRDGKVHALIIQGCDVRLAS